MDVGSFFRRRLHRRDDRQIAPPLQRRHAPRPTPGRGGGRCRCGSRAVPSASHCRRRFSRNGPRWNRTRQPGCCCCRCGCCGSTAAGIIRSRFCAGIWKPRISAVRFPSSQLRLNVGRLRPRLSYFHRSFLVGCRRRYLRSGGSGRRSSAFLSEWSQLCQRRASKIHCRPANAPNAADSSQIRDDVGRCSSSAYICRWPTAFSTSSPSQRRQSASSSSSSPSSYPLFHLFPLSSGRSLTRRHCHFLFVIHLLLFTSPYGGYFRISAPNRSEIYSGFSASSYPPTQTHSQQPRPLRLRRFQLLSRETPPKRHFLLPLFAPF